MTSTPIQQFINDLAATLRRSVVIDDPEVRLLYASPHYGDEDEVRLHAVLQRDAGQPAISHVLAHGVTSWTRAGVISAAPELNLNARVCVPIRWRSVLLGLLMVVDADGSVTTSEMTLLTSRAQDLAPLLLADQGLPEDSPSDHDAAVTDLFDERSAIRHDAVRTIVSSLMADGPRSVRVVELHAREVGAVGGELGVVSPLAIRHVGVALATARALQPRTGDAVDASWTIFRTRRDQSVAVLIVSPAEATLGAVDGLVERMLTELRGIAAGHFDVVAGIGSTVDGLANAWKSQRQALLAARSASVIFDRAVVHWADLGEYALLLRLPLSELGDETLPEPLQRLLAVDTDGRLLETVRVYLENAGSVPATAKALHIHRTSLYYRFDRLSELAELDLNDGPTRLALHMGLRVRELQARLTQARDAFRLSGADATHAKDVGDAQAP